VVTSECDPRGVIVSGGEDIRHQSLGSWSWSLERPGRSKAE